MEYLVFKASNKEAALQAIESRQFKIVELDYKSGNDDIYELGRIGRKYEVGVMYLAQESIVIPDEETLKDYLSKPKQTFKQRFLTLSFDLDSEALVEYQKQLSKLGDLILPKHFNPTITTLPQK